MNIQNNKRSNNGELPLQPQQKIQKVEPPPINALPIEMITHIFSFLDIHDLVKASLVNRHWLQIATYDGLWKAIAYKLGLQELDNMASFKTLISDTDIKIQESSSKFGALIPNHFTQKPRTISKLQYLFAWSLSLGKKNCLPCITNFNQNTSTNPFTYLTLYTAFSFLKLCTYEDKLLAEFVISHNIIDVWRQIAQKAGIQVNIDQNLALQFDSRLINSWFNQWMNSNLNSLQQVENLELKNLGLIMLPDGLQRLENLKELDISENSLHLIPHWIGNLTKLEHLIVNMNKLFFLPDSVRELKNLKVLHLYNNNFTKLPEVIKDLTNLETLDFGFTLITKVPDWIGNLSLLKDLAFPYAPVEQFSKSAGQLKKLERLDLSHTKLASLPPCLLKMENLFKLTINPSLCPAATDLPPHLKKLRIRIDGNEMSAQDLQLFKQLPPRRGYIKVTILYE
jgi:Leucine-rich repeat (LRR) protein